MSPLLGLPSAANRSYTVARQRQEDWKFWKTDSIKSVDNEKTNKLVTLLSPYFQNIFQKLQKNTFILKQTSNKQKAVAGSWVLHLGMKLDKPQGEVGKRNPYWKKGKHG